MSLLNTNTLLVLTGLVLLVINVIIAAVTLRAKQVRAGLISVGLALLACVLVVVGITRVSWASSSPSYQAAITAGGLEAMPPVLVALGGLVIVIASVVSYRLEARQPGFNPSNSSSLLNIGAGAFTLVAALVIPVIPLELAHPSANVAVLAARADSVSTQAPLPTSTPTETPGPSLTPLPTTTPTASGTPTPLPSLTPTLSETPIVLYTQIAYVSTYTVGVPVGCTITATTTLNLRGDPSVKQASIGRVLAGSVLNVLGRSQDSKWWYAVNTNGVVQVNGWVSADYVTHNSACDNVPAVDSAGHVIGPTGQASQTSMPNTLTPTAAPAESNAVTAAPCTLLTTEAADLRPDPSASGQSLAALPARTVLIANGKSLDGQWWQVAYGSKQGWISGSAVLPSNSCPQ